MKSLKELRQQYVEDGRPAAVGIIDRAITAMPSGELTDVISEAHAVDPLLADEITGIFLETLVG